MALGEVYLRLASSLYLRRLASSLLVYCCVTRVYHGLTRMSHLFSFMADTFSFQEAQWLTGSWMFWSASSKAPRYCKSQGAS